LGIGFCEAAIIQAASISGGRHPSWRVAVFSVHAQLPRRRGDVGQRGINISYETIRCWTIKFGPQIARRLKRRRPAPSSRWHLDEVVCNIGGKRMYLWRAVDDEGEVPDVVVQERRDHDAALVLLMRLLRNQPVEPEAIVTDGLPSYGSALIELALDHLHRAGRLRENNRAENSHLPIRRRERKM
jgi:putative transposase